MVPDILECEYKEPLAIHKVGPRFEQQFFQLCWTDNSLIDGHKGKNPMKKKDTILKEFARSLSDDDIRYISFRLSERKSEDVAEVVEWLQQMPEIDRVLGAAKDAGAYTTS
jgi:hypothetical protein